MRQCPAIALLTIIGAVVLAAGEASAPASTAPALHVRWSRQLPARQAAFATVTGFPCFDRWWQPVAAGGAVFLACEHDGSLLALDLATGAERWRRFTDAPLRVAPVIVDDQVCVGGEDGLVRAFAIADGAERWRARLGPSGRRCIAHDRLSGVWGLHGGICADSGGVYGIAGYWPVDGVFLAALDVRTGAERWQVQVEARCHPGPGAADGKVSAAGRTFDAASGAELGKGGKPGKPKGQAAAATPPTATALDGAVVVSVAAAPYTLVTTDRHRLYALHAEVGKTVEHALPAAAAPAPAAATAAARLLALGGKGWVLVLGLEDGALAEALAAGGAWRVVAVDSDAARVDAVRARLAARQAFDAGRLQVVQATPAELPPYVFDLVASEAPARLDAATLGAIAPQLKPWGGVLALPAAQAAVLTDLAKDGLAAATADGYATLRRPGALPGAQEWTHEMADTANSASTGDPAVKAPYSTLWWGGRMASMDNYAGEHWLPAPGLVCQGRIFLMGWSVRGYDQYTGRLLWEHAVPQWWPGQEGLGIHNRGRKNPWEIPEAMAMPAKPTEIPRTAGYNFCAVPGGVYVGAHTRLLRLDNATGTVLGSWPAFADDDGTPLFWGSVKVADGVALTTLLRADDCLAAKPGHDGNGGHWAKNRMPHRWMAAFGAEDGKLRWKRKAGSGFVPDGIAIHRGRIAAVDLAMDNQVAGMKAANRPVGQPMILCLDLATGGELWKKPMEQHAPTILIDAARDALIVPARHGLAWTGDAWAEPAKKGRKGGDAGRLLALKLADGAVIYDRSETTYKEPMSVLGEWLFTRYGESFAVATGEPLKRRDPLTAVDGMWDLPRMGGCTNVFPSLGFAAGRGTWCDVASMLYAAFQQEGGCSPHYIAAGGIVNGPSFGTRHGSTASLPLALVPSHESQAWYAVQTPDVPGGTPFARVGFNLNAPGARTTADGVYWLPVADKADKGRVGLRGVKGRPEGFRLVPHRVAAATPDALPWVGASGYAGIEELTIATFVENAKLPGPKPGAQRFRVRLAFCEPDAAAKPGERVFTVTVGDAAAIADLDPVALAGGPRRVAVKEVEASCGADGLLTIRLAAKAGGRPAVLSGIELIRK